MRSTPATPTRGRKVPRKGWSAAIGNPVPGNIDAALTELGIDVVRMDVVEHYALCPAHEERTGKKDHSASWSVNEDTGAHFCFSCGFQGSFVALVSYVQGIHYEDAALWVRARGGIERAKRKLAAIQAPTKVDTTKVISEASLALFDPPPASALASRNLSAEAARQYGVLWDPKRECWITPVRDPLSYKLLGWQEKNARIFKNQPFGIKKSTTLFGVDCFVEGETAVLVESPLDCLRLYTAGVTGALSSFGVVVSDIQMSLILDRTDNLIVALDNDAAGAKACKEILDNWRGRGLRIRFFSYDHAAACKDPGDMTDDQITQGITDAYSSVWARF